MQNRQHKKLEDKGWNMMQQMLDQELPASKEKEENRRGFLWFWMGGAVVLISAFLWSNWGGENSTPQQPIVEKIEEKIASKELPSAAQEEDENEAKIIETSSKSNTNNSSISKPVATENKPKAIKTIFESNPIIQNISTSEPLDNQVVTSTSNHSTKVVDEKNIREQASATVSKITPKSIDVIPLLATQLSFLEGKNQLTDLTLPQTHFAKAKKVKRRKKLKGSWLANASMTSTLGGDINGLKTGVIYELSLSSKWALSTGLNYRLSRQNNLRLSWGDQHIGSGGLDLNNAGVTPTQDTTLPGGVSSNDEYYYDANKEALRTTNRESYHFVSIPISANYRFAKKWNLTFGVESSYLFNFPTALKRSDERTLDSSFIQGNDPLFGTRFSLLRLDFAATLGTSFQINKSWSANLDYHHGNLLQMNNWQPNNQYLQLGMGYRF